MLRADVLAAWHAGLEAADARAAVERALRAPDLAAWREPTLVIATGKAAAAMARGVEAPARGFVLLPRDAPAGALPTGVELLRADHPIPTASGIEASRVVLRAARTLRPGERLLYLISGGTSALFEIPRAGVSEGSLIDIHRALFACGAAIAEMNVVRRALSAVKGGGLLRASSADVITLAVSDVLGDDPATIGSGPTVPVADERGAARVVLERVGLWERAGDDVKRALSREALAESVGARSTGTARFEIVCSAERSAEAARAELGARGYEFVVPPVEHLSGDAVEAARGVAAVIARQLRVGERPWGFAMCGETTLAVPASAGRGGRNQHAAATIARELAGHGGFACVVAGTDGVDGNSENAGAVVDGAMAERAAEAGHELGQAQARFDVARALEACGAALRLGPTGTNVGDLLVAVGAPR